jgi:anti-sigma factor RsiW
MERSSQDPHPPPVEAIAHVARCQECVDLLVDFLEGELPPDRARALEIHLELCPPCWKFVRTYRGTVDVARTLPVEEIPPELTLQLIEFLKREKEGTLPPF